MSTDEKSCVSTDRARRSSDFDTETVAVKTVEDVSARPNRSPPLSFS